MVLSYSTVTGLFYKVIHGDLRTVDVRWRAVDGVSTVYHVAAAFREARLSDAEYRAINVDATAALVDAAGEMGVERFVHCSTCGVHGHVEHSPANEDAPLRAGDVYQLTKLMGEQADVCGHGGKMIRSIVERTGTKIDVEDDGRVNVASADKAAAQKAIAIIQELTATPELNRTYLGKVQRITNFGAFVEIMPGLDGLLHVSEIAHHRVKDVRDELREGDQVMVKVINIDPTGKIRLSRKALLPTADAVLESERL